MMMWFGVTPSFTVDQVMLMIERVTDMQPRQQVLMYKLWFLLPGQTLAHYNVQNNDVIYLSARMLGGATKGGWQGRQRQRG